MSGFKIGDRVVCRETHSSSFLEKGGEYTVERVTSAPGNTDLLWLSRPGTPGMFGPYYVDLFTRPDVVPCSDGHRRVIRETIEELTDHLHPSVRWEYLNRLGLLSPGETADLTYGLPTRPGSVVLLADYKVGILSDTSDYEDDEDADVWTIYDWGSEYAIDYWSYRKVAEELSVIPRVE